MLPDSFPKEARDFYSGVHAKSYTSTRDDVLAHKVAWEVTKSRMKMVNGNLVCNAIDFVPVQLFRFQLEEPSDVVITNHDDGEIELDISLAHTGPNLKGQYFAEEDLQYMAEQINSEGSTIPDVNHDIIKKMSPAYNDDPEALALALKREKGVFKRVKAVVANGKLWIKAFLDKRYKSYAEQFRKVSIEAIGKVDNTGRVVKPRYLGFTFTSTPQLQGVGVAD
jgi:hypothetical protein